MPRIRLNRPPPVSGETAKDVASENTAADSLGSNAPTILSESQTEDFRTTDVSSVFEKDSSNVKLINSEYTSTTAEDTRRVVEHKRTIVRDVCKKRDTSVPENASQFVSDSSPKKPKKKHCHHGVHKQADSVHKSLPSSDDTETHRTAHAVANSSDESFFCDNSYYSRPSEETVMPIEPQHIDTGVNINLTGSLLDDMLKGFLVKKLEVIENERKCTDLDRKDHVAEAVLQNKPNDFSPTSNLRRRKRSRENDEQQRDFDCLPAKSRYILPHHDNEYTKAHAKSCLGNRPHILYGGYDRLPPPISYSFTGFEDMTKHSLSTEGRSLKRGHREHQHKHSVHAERHSEKKVRQIEHRPQSFDLPHLERSQSSEHKSIDCYEQIRAFVSHTIPRFAEPVGQDHVPHESSVLKTHDRKRQTSGIINKSGSDIGHHRRHHHHCHHHKKQKSAKPLTEDKKFAEHDIAKNTLQTTKNVQKDILTSKKQLKHKHRHHHRKSTSTLPDVTHDYKDLDKNETVPHTETKAEVDTFEKSRSLSPLGVHHKHHKKRKKKKKSSEKTVSEISEQNMPSLLEKTDTQYDKISSDEEFIPMKVQRNEDNEHSTGSEVLHKVDMTDTAAVILDQTNRKSATELHSKFFKVSGKRPKRRPRVSDASPSAESYMSSEHVQNSSGSVGDEPVQNASDCKVVENAVVDSDTTEETLAPVRAASQDIAEQTSTLHEVLATENAASSVEAVSCSDSDSRGVVQTTTVNADDADNNINGDGQSCSPVEVNMTSQRSVKSVADGVSLTQEFASDAIPQSRETEHQETGKEACACDNNDFALTVCAGKTDISGETAGGEELKSHSEEHAAGDTLNSEKDQLETLTSAYPDIEPDAVQKTPSTEEGDKDRTEVNKAEEVGAVKDQEQTSADQQSVLIDSVTATENCQLQPNQTATIETLPTNVTTSGEDTSVTNTAENTSSSSADQPSAPGTLMGPPLALPPAPAFKKPLPVMKMRLRITDTSASIISSGAKNSDSGKQAQDDESREEGNYVLSFVDKLLLISR